MTNTKKLLQNLTGERVTIYTVEKQFTGILDQTGNEFHVSNQSEYLKLHPKDIINIKELCSNVNIIFVKNHFPF